MWLWDSLTEGGCIYIILGQLVLKFAYAAVNVVYSLVDKEKWLHHEHGSPITVSKNQLVTRASELCSILRYEFIFAPVSTVEC